MSLLKMAQQSLRARIAEDKHGVNIERSFYFLNTRTMCAIFLFNWTQCIDGIMLVKVTMKRTQAMF